MNAGFMAALIVMLIMIAFTFIVVRMIAFSTGNRIRDYVVMQMQTYDVLIDKKSAELNEIREQLKAEREMISHKEKHQTANNEIKEVYAPSYTEYRNYELFSDYRNLKDNFLHHKKDIAIQIDRLMQKNLSDEVYNNLEQLLLKLNIDNVYKISTLQAEEQLDVIREVITDNEQRILDEFMVNQETFSCVDFYQWLYVRKVMNDNRIRIKTSETYDMNDNKSKLITVEYDEGLCEGFQILQGNRLYDYGIRTSELV